MSSSWSMTDTLLVAAIVFALGGAASLCGALISRRAHERRVEARIRETIHLYAVVRAFFAERRSAV
jgi:hypothetical protein